MSTIDQDNLTLARNWTDVSIILRLSSSFGCNDFPRSPAAFRWVSWNQSRSSLVRILLHIRGVFGEPAIVGERWMGRCGRQLSSDSESDQRQKPTWRALREQNGRRSCLCMRNALSIHRMVLRLRPKPITTSMGSEPPGCLCRVIVFELNYIWTYLAIETVLFGLVKIHILHFWIPVFWNHSYLLIFPLVPLVLRVQVTTLFSWQSVSPS